MNNWITFLHRLGSELSDAAVNDSGPVAFVSLPFLDYASVIVASGIISKIYEGSVSKTIDVESWRSRTGEQILFPFRRLNGGTELRRHVGVVGELEERKGRLRVSALIRENEKIWTTRLIETRWLDSVRKSKEIHDLESRRLGTLLAENIDALDELLGKAGTERLLRKTSKDMSK